MRVRDPQSQNVYGAIQNKFTTRSQWRQTVDLSKISKGGMVFTGGSILFLIASFLTWFSLDERYGLGASNVGYNGFDTGFLWCTLWVVVFIGLSVILVLPAFGVDAPKIPPIAFLAAGALGALLVILKLLIGDSYFGADFSRSIGIYIAAIAAIIVAFGGFLKFQESGGNLNDLKDMNKLKSSFGGPGGGTPPPPPPPGMTPPPPPPPPAR